MTNFKFTATSDLQKVRVLTPFLANPQNEVQKALQAACREFKAANLLDSHTSRLRGRQHLLNAYRSLPRHHHLMPMLRFVMN